MISMEQIKCCLYLFLYIYLGFSGAESEHACTQEDVCPVWVGSRHVCRNYLVPDSTIFLAMESHAHIINYNKQK